MYVFGEMGMQGEAIGRVTVYRVKIGQVVPWPACSFGDLCDHRVVMLLPD